MEDAFVFGGRKSGSLVSAISVRDSLVSGMF